MEFMYLLFLIQKNWQESVGFRYGSLGVFSLAWAPPFSLKTHVGWEQGEARQDTGKAENGLARLLPEQQDVLSRDHTGESSNHSCTILVPDNGIIIYKDLTQLGSKSLSAHMLLHSVPFCSLLFAEHYWCAMTGPPQVIVTASCMPDKRLKRSLMSRKQWPMNLQCNIWGEKTNAWDLQDALAFPQTISSCLNIHRYVTPQIVVSPAECYDSPNYWQINLLFKQL